MKLVGYCLRHTEEIASKFDLWQPCKEGENGSERSNLPDIRVRNSGIENQNELKTAMLDRGNQRACEDGANRDSAKQINCIGDVQNHLQLCLANKETNNIFNQTTNLHNDSGENNNSNFGNS